MVFFFFQYLLGGTHSFCPVSKSVDDTRCVQAFKLRNKDLHSLKSKACLYFGLTNTYKYQQAKELNGLHFLLIEPNFLLITSFHLVSTKASSGVMENVSLERCIILILEMFFLIILVIYYITLKCYIVLCLCLIVVLIQLRC